MSPDKSPLLRIAVSGSHSTGKTTLANDLGSALNEAGIGTIVAPEPIRLLSPEMSSVVGAERFTRLLQIHFKRLAQEGYRCCVLDRSLVDFCVYMKVEKVEAKSVYNLARDLLPWYLPHIATHLYLPPEIDLEADGFRPTRESFRQEIDVEFRRLSTELEVSLTRVTGTAEERCQQALKLAQAALQAS